MLHNILAWDAEDPLGLLLANAIRNVLEYHLGLLAAEDEASLRQAFEGRLVLPGLVWHLLPLELVALARRVDGHESPSILDARAKTVELDDLVLGVHRRHVLLFALSVGAWR